ncbi:hypothetical protein QBC45DRAFT_32880 [Copromyces sp. CBS 386.78]|nr:hypothetical protein QBC45DRAFT_32880 [Copromyces sp. CBS 386.78]
MVASLASSLDICPWVSCFMIAAFAFSSSLVLMAWIHYTACTDSFVQCSLHAHDEIKGYLGIFSVVGWEEYAGLLSLL